MTTTYYECIDDLGMPATTRQRQLYGSPRYGYRSRIVAELNCPDGASVRERHTDGRDDWSGRVVSWRMSNGTLQIVIPR